MAQMLIRKMLAVLVLVMFLLSTGTAAAASQVFSDVPGNHWAAKDIARMKAKGVLGGVSAASYAPNDPVTREMLVVMLVRVLGKQGEASGTIPASFIQRDKVSSYAIGSVAYAVREGIISGGLLHSDPRGPVSRHEVAEIVVRAMGMASEAAAKQNASLNYTDTASIPFASRGFVAVMQEKGIMGGGADGKFNPNDPLTRAQIASVLNRVDNQVKALTANTIKGKVFGVSSSVLTIENASGVIQPINLASGVLVFRPGGAARVTDLTPGQMVEVITDAAGRALYVDQGQFEFDQVALEGEITDIISGQNLLLLTIKDDKGKTDTYTLSSSATIKIDNQAASASQLAKGQPIKARVTGKTITSLEISDAHRIINGTIKNIDLSGKTVTIERTGGLGDTLVNVDTTTVIELARKEVDLKDLIEGQEVMVIARGVKATKIDAQNLEKTITGVLVSISFTPDVTITVLNEATEKEETYKVDENVSIRRDRTRNLTLRDIFPGDEVDVDLKNRIVTSIFASKVESKTEGNVKEVRIGAVPTLVIVTNDGKEESYPIASTARIRRDGLSVSLHEIQYGDWVRLEVEGRQAVRVDVEARYTNRYLIGTVENIHKAAQVIVVSEMDSRENRQVFWDSDTVVIRNNRIRDVEYLSQRDEVVIAGRFDGGLFWANTIVIIVSRD